MVVFLLEYSPLVNVHCLFGTLHTLGDDLFDDSKLGCRLAFYWRLPNADVMRLPPCPLTVDYGVESVFEVAVSYYELGIAC